MKSFFGGNYEIASWNKLTGGIMTDRQKIVIGIKGIGHGAGATFMAVNLAFQMAEMEEGITFISGKERREGWPDAGHLLSVDSRFRKNSGRRPANLYKKINWILNPSEMGFQRDEYRELPGKFIIVDDPENMEDLDMTVAIADPLPSRIEAGLQTYIMLRNLNCPVIWILNKNNRQAGIHETEKFLKIKFDFYVELLPPEIFYKAENNCTQSFFIRKPQAIEKVAERILTHNK